MILMLGTTLTQSRSLRSTRLLQTFFSVRFASVSVRVTCLTMSPLEMSRDAKECDYCNKLYCKLCIENWLVLNKDCPMCHLDIKIRGASRVVKEIIYSFRIQCSHCPAVVRLSEIEKHETQCGKILCDSPTCKKPLKNSKYFQVVTQEGKLNVCNDICEQMAKFHKLRLKGGYIDCLKFYQATLSSGGKLLDPTDQKVAIKPKNPDIDSSRRAQRFAAVGIGLDDRGSQTQNNHN